jgi:diaminopimelate decarboxylase
LRVNPHVDADTHRYITTGTHENKFGIDWTLAEAAFVQASRMRGIDLAGIHTHIGSQITKPGPFLAAVDRIDGLLSRLARKGIRLRIRNLGGGMGISYRPGQARLDARAVARLVGPHLARHPMRLVLEPGRYTVGEAGALVTRVIYVKQGVTKRFAIVDAAMNDLIRPPLYEAHHEIVPVAPRGAQGPQLDIVGPVCESADFLGKGRRLGELRRGDLLAVLSAGAYGSVMSSNYNARPRAAEVLVDGRGVKLIRKRETIRDLMRGE